MNTKFHYRCTDCGAKYTEQEVSYLCPECEKENSEERPPKGVLKAVYDYDSIRAKTGKQSLFSDIQNRGFIDLLPIQSVNSLPNLQVGNTPLYRSLERDFDIELYFKDDSQNPTYSYKDRASAMVSAYAKEQNRDTIVAASTGNAGSSLAGICAAQQQKAVILVPESAPKAKLTQIMMYGARIVPVKGNYDDAFNLSMEASRLFGWYNRNTAYNPITVEGKKIAAFELYDQLGETIPDFIFVPVGDGCIISGIYKGFEDLLKLKIIDRMPLVVAVQSAGSKNLAANLQTEDFQVYPSKTIADSISVDIPRNFYMARQFLTDYYGKSLIVEDKEILQASKKLAETSGLFAEPAAAAAHAGFHKYLQEKGFPKGAKVVVLLTGSGLKDLQSLSSILKLPHSVEPNTDSLKQFFKE